MVASILIALPLLIPYLFQLYSSPFPGLFSGSQVWRDTTCREISADMAIRQRPDLTQDIASKEDSFSYSFYRCQKNIFLSDERTTQQEYLLSKISKWSNQKAQLLLANYPDMTLWYTDSYFTDTKLGRKHEVALQTELFALGAKVSHFVTFPANNSELSSVQLSQASTKSSTKLADIQSESNIDDMSKEGFQLCSHSLKLTENKILVIIAEPKENSTDSRILACNGEKVKWL